MRPLSVAERFDGDDESALVALLGDHRTKIAGKTGVLLADYTDETSAPDLRGCEDCPAGHFGSSLTATCSVSWTATFPGSAGRSETRRCFAGG
jgi:hypothetical protein